MVITAGYMIIGLCSLNVCHQRSRSSWMAGYKLKLNPDKTEFIVFGPKKKGDSLLKNFPY